jgi:hypothetical protein
MTLRKKSIAQEAMGRKPAVPSSGCGEEDGAIGSFESTQADGQEMLT